MLRTTLRSLNKKLVDGKWPLSKILKFWFENEVSKAKSQNFYHKTKWSTYRDKYEDRIWNVDLHVSDRFILEQMMHVFEQKMSDFLSGYRKNVTCQNVLLCLIEQWHWHLHDNKVISAVLMDLSKVFDCLLHDVLIANMAD